MTMQATKGDEMADWRIEGRLLIACNCDYGCPCNFNARPSYGDCEGMWTWHVDRGTLGDVQLDGVTFSVFADWPAAVHEGGGKAVAYVDESASAEAREAVAMLMRGGVGGPWAIFINTYTLDGPHFAPFDVELSEHTSRDTIGDVAKLEMEPIRNPVSGDEAFPSVRLPQGLVLQRGVLRDVQRLHGQRRRQLRPLGKEHRVRALLLLRVSRPTTSARQGV